jgi:hypothetical protein
VKLLVTFGAICDAFRCDECLKAAEFICEVIPESRRLGLTCNYAVAVEGIGENEVNRVLEVIARNDIKHVRLFYEN